MGETARRAFVATAVALGVVVLALALWKIRLVVALTFAGFIVAAAMRPGIEALNRRGVPKTGGLILHYAVIAGVLAVVLWFAVPRALHQVTAAVENLPQTRHAIGVEAKQSSGIKQEILLSLQRRLKEVPSGHTLFTTLKTIGVTAFEIGIGIFFVFAVAGYWIFERDRALNVVTELLPRSRRKVVRDTWLLIDLKLGAFVRGQLILILLVGTVLSLAFWVIGVPYWILVGSFAGIVEIVPVIGPLAAGVVAIAVGLTVSLGVALGAGLAVLGVRLFEDYVVVPKVLGHAVGLSPLVVLVSVTAIGLLLGGVYVLLAVPIAAVLVTLVDVVVRDKDPAEEEVPTLLFPAQDAEA